MKQQSQLRNAPFIGESGAAPAGASLKARTFGDRVRALRDRLFTNPSFVRWAERFPLTRPIARREARALFDICGGFVYSQTLFACVKLKVFEVLSEGPLDETALALRLDLDPGAVRRLMVAAAALRLIEKRSRQRWGLGWLGAAVLASPGLGAMVEHHALLYRDLADPVALLKGEAQTRLSAYWPYAHANACAGAISLHEDDATPYSALMAATQPVIAEEILDAVSFKTHHCLMDVGGGDGSFLKKAAARWPHLELILFDLPAVAKTAQTKLQTAGLQSRIVMASGDFAADDLPTRADVITLIRVILDHDDARALGILRNVRKALSSNGTLILAEPMADTKGAETVAAYFNFYLLAMGRGRPRTAGELRELLRQSGFKRIREASTCQPILTRILVANP